MTNNARKARAAVAPELITQLAALRESALARRRRGHVPRHVRSRRKLTSAIRWSTYRNLLSAIPSAALIGSDITTVSALDTARNLGIRIRTPNRGNHVMGQRT
jgi:hypothetical protein